MNLHPTSPEAVQEAVRSHQHLRPKGGGSKTALFPAHDQVILDLSTLRGVLKYQPEEFTFTALAGTSVAEVQEMLRQQGQYLPFDPPTFHGEATLGGTVAAGLSGPGRYRYGGVRDFILEVRFVDGMGNLVRGGGKVVKNAAGFDIPKLMVGSLGQLGIMTELTFKVFPQPPAYATLAIPFANLPAALEALYRFTASPLEADAVELEPSGRLLIRIGGLPDALPRRLERLQQLLGAGDTISGVTEEQLWQQAREWAWRPSGSSLIKIPLTPRKVLPLEQLLQQHGAERRYNAGAQVAWVAWNGPIEPLHNLLLHQGLSGLLLLGDAPSPLLGQQKGQSFLRRIKVALDPHGKFSEHLQHET